MLAMKAIDLIRVDNYLAGKFISDIKHALIDIYHRVQNEDNWRF